MSIDEAGIARLERLSFDAKKRSYQDSVDRIEVERGFSLSKRCFGLGLIRTKLDIRWYPGDYIVLEPA